MTTTATCIIRLCNYNNVCCRGQLCACNVCIYVCMPMYICVCLRMCVCIFIGTYMCIFVCVYLFSWRLWSSVSIATVEWGRAICPKRIVVGISRILLRPLGIFSTQRRQVYTMTTINARKEVETYRMHHLKWRIMFVHICAYKKCVYNILFGHKTCKFIKIIEKTS